MGTPAPETDGPIPPPWTRFAEVDRTSDGRDAGFVVRLTELSDLRAVDDAATAVFVSGLGIYRAEAVLQLEGRTLHVSPTA